MLDDEMNSSELKYTNRPEAIGKILNTKSYLPPNKISVKLIPWSKLISVLLLMKKIQIGIFFSCWDRLLTLWLLLIVISSKPVKDFHSFIGTLKKDWLSLFPTHWVKMWKNLQIFVKWNELFNPSQVEMALTWAYFKPALNKKPTRLWARYFLNRPEEIFFWPEEKKFDIFRGNLPNQNQNHRWLRPDPSHKKLTWSWPITIHKKSEWSGSNFHYARFIAMRTHVTSNSYPQF